MSEPAAYELSQIVNDDIILYLNGTVILGPGESDTIYLPNNDDYWYLQLEQTTGHPYPEPIGLLSNNCQHTTDTLPRIFNSLPNGNGNPFVATLCREVVGPYDPNDKFAEPTGLTAANYIERDWPLDYTIQFQNVGTDRARNVILEDTLSPLLNLATFVPLAASHDYRWSISEDRLLRVVFTDINLPDSTSNEVGSHGFFSFQIQPAADAPFEADILNFADIYFDFNPAIRTGTTQHRIRKPIRSGSEQFSLCPGDSFAGIAVFQDTLIREEYSFTEYDSVQFYHITILDQPERQVFITLDEPGMWEGLSIGADTMITRVFTAANGCDSLVHVQIDVLTNSLELEESIVLKVHPNPAQDYTMITWQADVSLRSWQLVNPLGQLLQKGHQETRTGTLRLDTSTLPVGTYELLLLFDAGQIQRRLQIVR